MEKIDSTPLVYFIRVMQQFTFFSALTFDQCVSALSTSHYLSFFITLMRKMKSNRLIGSDSANDSTQCMNRLSTGVLSFFSAHIYSAVFSVQFRQHPMKTTCFLYQCDTWLSYKWCLLKLHSTLWWGSHFIYKGEPESLELSIRVRCSVWDVSPSTSFLKVLKRMEDFS